jgi:hypothetical protein
MPMADGRNETFLNILRTSVLVPLFQHPGNDQRNRGSSLPH